ncbi:hypothetical protein NN561_020131 [Cricetulus griseus]
MCSMRIRLFLKTFPLTFRYKLWYMWWSVFLDSRYLLRSQLRIRILRTQVTFSRILALAVPFCFPMLICLPFRRAKCFSSIGPGMNSHGLLDDQPIFDHFPYLLMGVGIGHFIGLIGIQRDLLFTKTEDARGKPLLYPEHTHGCGRSSERQQ